MFKYLKCIMFVVWYNLKPSLWRNKKDFENHPPLKCGEFQQELKQVSSSSLCFTAQFKVKVFVSAKMSVSALESIMVIFDVPLITLVKFKSFHWSARDGERRVEEW